MTEAEFAPETTRAAALAAIAARLAAAGIDNARREARLLLVAALGVDAGALIADGDMALGLDAPRVGDFARRRAAREPLDRIVGAREFFGLNFRLTPATLSPRADTETVVETALDLLRAGGRIGDALRIADIGVGSGAILAALLSALPNASGVGVDLSAEAAETARANLGALLGPGRAQVCVGAWLAPLAGAFDLIVSNPPYIPSGDIAGLDPEVAFADPALALDGGADGLDAYRALATEIPARLAPGGLVVLELGIGQGPAVAALFAARGFAVLELRADLGGVPRALALGGDALSLAIGAKAV